MSSIRERTRKDGTVYWAVLWREDGKQRAQGVNDYEMARRFRDVLDLAGEAAARADAEADQHSEHTLTSWTEHHIEHRSGITEGTRAEYLRMWRRTFGREIGGLPLDVVNRDAISLAVTHLSKNLSSKTVKNARDLLATALADAVEQGHLPTNPTKGVRIPRVRADESDTMRCLSRDEWLAIRAELPDHWRTIFELLIATGMRINEATALQVKDVDLDARTVRVMRAWKRAAKGWELGPPKTRRSRRTIGYSPSLDLEPYVTGRRPDELLFTSLEGNRVHDGNLRTRVWHPACRRAGVTPLPRVHDLRHTHASWLIAAGRPLTAIQRRLGHESISTTSDVYGHLMPDTMREDALVSADALPQITAG